MTERRAQPLSSRTLGDDDARRLWDAFRAGAPANCPHDAAPFALAVDAATKSYRLVCTRCGLASLWFEPSAGGIQVRSVEDTLTNSGLSDD
jgi:hypothetical protein